MAVKSASVGKAPDTAAVKPPVDSVKHTVKAGETLSTIAKKYGVKYSDIAVANNITNPQSIRAGMELVIPGWQPAGGKSAKSGAKPAAMDAAPKPAPVPLLTPPGPGQDLDAGLKPASGGVVPVIKVDDAPSPVK